MYDRVPPTWRFFKDGFSWPPSHDASLDREAGKRGTSEPGESIERSEQNH